MSKRFLTVLILSNDSTKTKQYKIPLARYKLMRNALVVFALVFSYICFDYTFMWYKTKDFSAIKKENVAQKIELNRFSMKINEVEQQMDKLKLFDKKLRIIANIDLPEEFGGEVMGRGGPDMPGMDEAPGAMLTEKKNELVGQMHNDLQGLTAEATVREKSFTELATYLTDQSSLLASTPSVWPVKGWISSGYGKRRSPFTGLMESHKGIDIANRKGTEISAPADGRVIYAGRKGPLGKAVIISHGHGIKTTYGHLSKYNVKKGQAVKRGDVIAEMGSTGRSTGPHLHYDIAVNGVSVNPKKYILN